MTPDSKAADSTRYAHWARIIGQYSAFQIGVQAFAAASGILLIRTLSPWQYACFTLANSMQTAIVVLSDGAVAMGLSAIGGRIWTDRFRFGQLLRTALKLQRYLAVSAAVIIIPTLLWMLRRHGASHVYSTMLGGAVLLTLGFQLSSSVLGVVPRLHSQIKRLQNLEFGVALFRFVLLFLAYVLFINAFLAVFIAAVSMALQYAILRRWAEADTDVLHASADTQDQAEMLIIIKHQAPNAIFYCLQGQLTIWLISFFGTTRGIAEVGALSRLAIIYSVLGAVMSGVILPAFSRCQSRKKLNVFYFQIVGIFVLIGIGVLAGTGFFPHQCLWILGKNYAHLEKELFWMAVSMVLASVTSAMWSMNAAKAWIRNCWIEIPLRLLLELVSLFFVDISTVRGVILFGLYSNFAPFAVNLYLTYNGLWKRGLNDSTDTSLAQASVKLDARAA